MIPSDPRFKQQIDLILITDSASKNLESVGSEAHETQVCVEESHEIIVSNFLRPTVDMLYPASALSQAVQKNQLSINEGTLEIYGQMQSSMIQI